MRARRCVSGLMFLLAACGDDGAGTRAKLVGAPEWVARLDPAQGELPEGLALDPTAHIAYVGLAPTGQILAIDTRSGVVRAFGSVPMPPADQGYLFGLARSATGELFAGVASVSEAYRAGIYRLPASGGSATLFASHPELRFPNGLTFDVSGRLYVTDSLSGALFSIDGAGGTTLWLRDPSLLGDVGAPCANGAPFPIGANGVAWFEDRLYVVNSDHGTLLRIALQRDGSPGPIETMLGPDCTTLGGADGLAVDDEGTLFVAANARDAIVRIAPSGAARTIATGFDFPASVALDSATLFVTNAALKSARTQGAQPTPGLLRVPIAPP